MSKAARDSFSNIQTLCNEWTTSSPGPFSEQKETPKLSKLKQSYVSCVHAIKNTRRKMEDKHVILPHFNSLFGLNKGYPNLAFFAVYDGHGGADAAIYSSTHLHCFLASNKNLSVDPGLALHEAFLVTDETFGVKAKAEGLRSGCTAVVSLISSDKMYIGWLGDSQVVLCKAGVAVPLMEPHKPENQEERERIEALGGCVVYFGAWRVNGSLSVSRAIGDVEHKPYISGEPFIAEYTFEGDEEFIVLACDGLWDTVGREEAIELVTNHITQGNARDTAAKLLVDAAKDAGSNDNISVVVVYLDTHISSVPTDNIALTNQEDIKTNGIIKRDVKVDNNKDSNYQTTSTSFICKDPGGHTAKCSTCVRIVEKQVENHDSLVAKVKIPTETGKISKSVTCKVTSEKQDSCTNGDNSCETTPERTSKSADNSPKQSRKGKSSKSRGSTQPRKSPKGKSSNQLGVAQDTTSRRKSAPAGSISS